MKKILQVKEELKTKQNFGQTLQLSILVAVFHFHNDCIDPQSGLFRNCRKNR